MGKFLIFTVSRTNEHLFRPFWEAYSNDIRGSCKIFTIFPLFVVIPGRWCRAFRLQDNSRKLLRYKLHDKEVIYKYNLQSINRHKIDRHLCSLRAVSHGFLLGQLFLCHVESKD